jgi:hypothetical protein
MTHNRALLDLDNLSTVFGHGLTSAKTLVALGVPGSTIHDRCRMGGPWQRLPSGLVLLSDAPQNRTQRVHEALTVAGQGAVLTGVDALTLHGLNSTRLEGPVHVLIPPRRQPRLVDGVLLERTHQLPAPLHLHGFPVAPLPRATVDTCRRAKQTEHIRILLTEALFTGGLTPTTLRDELSRGNQRGAALPRRVLAELDDNVRSMTQARARRLVQRASLPAPDWRVPITTPNGSHVATADAWWDEVGLAWQVDSYAFDLSPADAIAALGRAARLTAGGVLVVHTPPMQLREDPAAVAELLRTAYKQATTRPRPEVRAQCQTPLKSSRTTRRQLASGH